MIFVAVGTHPDQFDRLLKKIDEIAPAVKDKIVIQRGFTKYYPKNCESFEFTENMDEYYKKARLVIVQSATSLLEFVIKYNKPVITVPRQARFKEHINDHQVEFGEFFSQKTGIKCIINVNDLTPDLLNKYKKKAVIKEDNLILLQGYFRKLFDNLNNSHYPSGPFAHNRIDYIINLINPEKNDKVLNIGVSNIPEVEIKIENKVKECWTIDFDKKKMEKAKIHLKKTKLIIGDVTKTNELKKGYFDKIIIIEVLEHLKDDVKMIKKIRQLLKPDGVLIVGVPNDAFLHYFNPVKYFEHERHYSNDLIKDRLAENGLSIIHFNLAETWTLLSNLYLHLLIKYLLRINFPFGIFKRKANKTYDQLNKSGMDILIKAVKN